MLRSKPRWLIVENRSQNIAEPVFILVAVSSIVPALRPTLPAGTLICRIVFDIARIQDEPRERNLSSTHFNQKWATRDAIWNQFSSSFFTCRLEFSTLLHTMQLLPLLPRPWRAVVLPGRSGAVRPVLDLPLPTRCSSSGWVYRPVGALAALATPRARRRARRARFPEAVEVEAMVAPGVAVTVLEASLDWPLG